MWSRRQQRSGLEIFRQEFERGQRFPREWHRTRRAAFPAEPQWPSVHRTRYWYAVGARFDGLLVGFALSWTHSDNEIAVLDDVGVDPAFQQRGIGTAVCADAVEWMRELGCERVTAMATSSGAHRIFEKLAFEPVPFPNTYDLTLR